jgi:hypothetical protein
VRQGAAGQIGLALGSHVTGDRRRDTGYRGEPLHGGKRPAGGPGGVKLGNELAAKTVCGPGGSRGVMPSGSQGQQGSVAGSPRPAGRDILSEFGPDKARS